MVDVMVHLEPPPCAPMIGRAKELADALGQVDDGARLLTLTGPAGVGKTTLARHVAANAADRFALPPVWCSSSASDDADAVCERVGEALGMGARWSTSAAQYRAAVCAALQQRGRMLIVIDGVVPRPDVAPMVARWLEGGHAVVVVTSPGPLGAAGEACVAVPPLAEADALLEQRIRGVQPKWEPSATAREILGRVASSFARIPRAIELIAAAWIDDPHPRDLPLRRPGAVPETAVHDALRWSWERAEPWERAWFAELAPIRGFLDAAAAPALPAFAVASTDAALARLHHRGWLTMGGDPPVYSVPEDIRGLMREIDRDAYGQALHRHAAACLDRCEHWLTEAFDGGLDYALDRVAAERDELAGAFDDLAGSKRGDAFDRSILLRCAVVLDELSGHNGLATTKARVVRREIERGGPEDLVMARARLSLAKSLSFDGRLDDALEQIRRAREVGDGQREEALVAQADVAACIPLVRLGRTAEALQSAERAGERFRSIRHFSGEAWAVLEQASWLCSLGRHEEAREGLDRALVLFRRVSHRRGLVRVRAATAFWLLHQGDLRKAEEEFEKAIRLARDARAWRLAMVCRGYLGLLCFEAGRTAEALELLSIAVAQGSEMGDVGVEGYFLSIESAVRAHLDDLAGADTAWNRAAAALPSSGGFRGVAGVFHGHLALAQARAATRGADRDAWLRQAETARDDVDAELLSSSDDARIALRLLDRLLAEAGGRPSSAPGGGDSPTPTTLTVAHDGRWFEVTGQRVDLSRRPRLGRMLAVLTDAAERGDQALSPDELIALTWPGEKILRSAGLNRLRVALSALRSSGLREVIDRTPRGYRILPTALVTREDADVPPGS